MGWLTKLVDTARHLDPVGAKLHDWEATLPGSSAAQLEGLYQGFGTHKVGTDTPYGEGVKAWDIIGGGTKLSQNESNREWGRAIGTLVALYFGLAAAGAGAGGGASGGAAVGEAGAGASTGGVVGAGEAGTAAGTGVGIEGGSGVAGLGTGTSVSGLGTGTSAAGTSAGTFLGTDSLGAGAVGAGAGAGYGSSTTGAGGGAGGWTGTDAGTGVGIQGGSGVSGLDTGTAVQGLGTGTSAANASPSMFLSEGAGSAGFLGNLGDSVMSSLGNMSLGQWGQTGVGLYGLYNAMQQQRAAQAEENRRKQYQQRIDALMANPNQITSMPGYQAGLEAVQRSMAAQGFTGSGNMMAGLAKYGGDFYQQQLNNLTAQAGGMPAAQAIAAQKAAALSNQMSSLGLMAGGFSGNNAATLAALMKQLGY